MSSIECGGGSSLLHVLWNNYDELLELVHFNPVVLAEVELPNGAKYEFKYNEFGEIVEIHYPTGGHEKITYAEVESLASMNSAYQQTNRGVWVHEAYENNNDPTPATST